MSKPESSPLMLVGIGASAGGLEALKALLPALPSDRGLAFVIIVHLRAGQPSVMAEVLQPFSSMPVTQVTEDQEIEPNHIYVIPPGCNLSSDRQPPAPLQNRGEPRGACADRPFLRDPGQHARPSTALASFCLGRARTAASA